MLPSQTVENYLKAILQAQTALRSPQALVPMGQLASSLGVVPGTATTMVKALAESGLVRYEPYVGVRLTRAGERLAALVLRRHRLIELFLVKVMGMSWTEVHDEAENLEHAVSDRLIDRIDEMLGRPEVDPHGDPIPDAEGVVERQQYETLLTCPLNKPVRVSRVSDQDRDFLQFIERHDLKPGAIVRVEERDPAADSVRLRGAREFTIGARAASKVLVQTAVLVLSLLGITTGVSAQTSPPDQPRPFEIADNSFLVEEAFNQEAGIFQNIFNATRSNGVWEPTFTQEWPVGTQAHQFSYTLSWLSGQGTTGFGDTLINYRFQALMDGPGRPAFSPRLSLILPTGSSDRGLGMGSSGLQVNLPFSKQINDVTWHWNAGFTWFSAVESPRPENKVSLMSPFLAGSGIYRLRPMLHLMLESVANFDEYPTLDGTEREAFFTLSPGVRGGWNLGDQQLILGLAVPMTWGGGETESGAFLYLSYELPFKR
ncbi:MAG: iron dependent repressor, metal binding and dimerization domain protein [Vicinamibacterales bacterium]|jgi:DtxR family Mn-dependent transcriptional regulator